MSADQATDLIDILTKLEADFVLFIGAFLFTVTVVFAYVFVKITIVRWMNNGLR